MTDFADAFDGLLARFDPAVDALARQLVAMLTEVRPDLTGKVRTGWGSVNFRHPEAGYVCAVLPQARAFHADAESGGFRFWVGCD